MIRLEKVNGKNVWDLLKLRVSEEQKNFVADNDISMKKNILWCVIYESDQLF